MSMGSAEAILADAIKQLHQRWERVRNRWDDPASRQIQKEFIDPLDSMVRTAIRAVDQARGLMEQARRDCRDD